MLSVPDLATLARFLTDTDSTSLTNANLLILFNDALERIHGQILTETAGGRWPYGDVNYSAFPTYTQNLVNSQAEYQIDSLATGTYPNRYEPLTILGVEVLDQNGIWHPLTPITLEQIHQQGSAQVEFHKTDGRPLYYEKREHMVVLYPAPDNGVSVTLTAGLKIFHLRNAEQFDDVTTSSVYPGFPSPWHSYIAYDAALTYCGLYKQDRVPFIMNRLQDRERAILRFMGMREKDTVKKFGMKPISFS